MYRYGIWVYLRRSYARTRVGVVGRLYAHERVICILFDVIMFHASLYLYIVFSKSPSL